MRLPFIFYGFFALTCLGCATSVPTGSRTGDYNGYNEDLALVRPAYSPPKAGNRPTARPENPKPTPNRPQPTTGPATASVMPVNRQLDLVLDSIAQKNRSIRYAPGYRVQVYVGNERQQVDATKLTVYQNFPELSPYLSFQQPTYKLKVGDFMRKMDADRYFSSLRQLFPSAILQPDRVDVRRSLLIK
jgi:hypothetical protein